MTNRSFCNATSSPTPIVMLCCFLWPGLWVQYMVLQVDLQWQTGSWLLEALVAQVCHLACGCVGTRAFLRRQGSMRIVTEQLEGIATSIALRPCQG
uniref:Uncharacterized protein n=1 Tax=Terrapene triunguis TaxID=2587831 RepID=A0A674IRI5_9SAUR